MVWAPRRRFGRLLHTASFSSPSSRTQASDSSGGTPQALQHPHSSVHAERPLVTRAVDDHPRRALVVGDDDGALALCPLDHGTSVAQELASSDRPRLPSFVVALTHERECSRRRRWYKRQLEPQNTAQWSGGAPSGSWSDARCLRRGTVTGTSGFCASPCVSSFGSSTLVAGFLLAKYFSVSFFSDSTDGRP